MSRLELLKEIKTELIDMEQDIKEIKDFKSAKRCIDKLAELWNHFKVLDIEEQP